MHAKILTTQSAWSSHEMKRKPPRMMKPFLEVEIYQLTPCARRVEAATEDIEEPEEDAEAKVAEDTTTKKELDPKLGPGATTAAMTMNKTSASQKAGNA